MNTFRQIVEIIKKEKGKKWDNEIADILGRTNISQDIKRNTIPLEEILSICTKEKWSLDWLLGLKPVARTVPVELKLEIVERPSKRFFEIEGGRQLENYIPIPVLADAAAGGSPREMKDDDIASYAVIYKTWCRNPDNYTCAKMIGDSMSPILENDSIVAINHAQRDPKALNGKMVAFRKDGGVTIKWLRLVEKDLVFASPENKESKEYYSFRGEEIDKAIIGKIEWWWGRQK